ncbi:MAG: hypothetical protein V4609_08980, partial [Pseudomonadota bacterium]
TTLQECKSRFLLQGCSEVGDVVCGSPVSSMKLVRFLMKLKKEVSARKKEKKHELRSDTPFRAPHRR